MNGRCAEITNLNTICNITQQCTSVGLGCIKNFCKPQKFAGEFCSISQECLSQDCSNGVCVGYPNGSPCVASFDNRCGPNYFCKFNGTFFSNTSAAGECVPNLGVGMQCAAAIGYGKVLPLPFTSIVTSCAAGLICDTVSGVCTAPGMLTSSASFLNTSSPALCSFNQSFASVEGGYGCYSYCGTGPNDPLCNDGQPCLCGNTSTPTAGVCAPDPCASNKNAIVACLTMNDCKDTWSGPQFQSLIWRSLTNGTCIYNNCQQTVWDYECCLTNYGTRGDLTPGVACSSPPTAPPAPAVASALSSCFLLLLSIIFFVFVVHL